ncbi:A-kinase anchor protein 11 isoform X6 [Falco rusticolus]|uniref:A-kinase anchor protein 11 isoform X6 n=1 Tax=Falco rusticolus TaxID=120794 RepID=UPI001886509C|nr:A-kinase anchor protein 11 isoform X6 [Falco rusticolus]
MDMYARTQGNRMKPRISMKKSFGEGVLHSMKSLLHSRKELCSVSSEECLSQEEQDNFIEITFIGFAEEMGTAHLQELAAVSVELPDVLKSFQLCKLKENEVIFLKDLKKTLAKPYVMKHQNQLPEVFCVMRLSPSFPRIKVDYIFTLLSKYTTGVRYVVEVNSLQKHQTEASHGEDDDTNQSVSSIEDDFVTAFEHLDEDEPSKIQSAGTSSFTSRNHRDTASQTIPSQCLEAVDSKFLVGSAHRKSSTRSSTLIDILGLKELSSVKNSVTTSISDPWIQRSFYKPYNPCDQGVNFLCKTLFSSSPAESSESDCSSPSPIIFLDEEGYQKSLKAKLQLPKIPVVKDGIEDSDSEVSEFFDSFDQFDELEQALENSCKVIRDPILGNPSQKRRTGHEQLSSASITMNPQKFKFDRPTLPANVKKPTPLKPESPYSSVFDVPDSPRPVKTPGEENGGLFSPIRSSAFSPLGSCGSSECLCRINLGGDGTGQNHHDAVYNSYSAYADSVSFEILGSVFHSKSSSEQVCAENDSKHKGIALKEKKGQAGDLKMKTSKEPDKQAKSKHKSLMIRDSIQKFATELVEKSFGSAFKDLQKGVSSCTNALCHLAARLTSSVFQMAFYEIGRRRAVSLKERAINGIASFLVSEAITGALKELRHVKKQIFTNTVARFAADLAEELVFEGIMEVCQFSYPSTPTAAQPSSFDYEDKVCFSESKDCWQDQKGHRFSSKSPPPCSAVTFARHFLEDFTDTGSCSVTCLNRPSKKHDTHKPSPGPLAYRQADCFLRANSFSSVMFGSEDALQMEDKSSLQDGNTRVMPDTPPPTPLVPCQGSSERNLRKLSKKLKGELAKEFAPATPPSTPYNPSVTELSETEHDSLENEEFMLKLMRSLSEEVESSEDEDHSEMAVEKEEHSEKTNQYADCLASHIISVATEMAASHLDGKTNEREACRQVQLGMQNKRCGYTALTNVPEQMCNSLWNYAGDMAGKVISEAKKIVKSRHCKLLRLKRVNCQVDCLYVRKGDYRSKDRCGPAREQWLGERDSSALPLPQDSGMTGLTSKYPSCESVTDEYADHIIRVLKREGGNAELLMDQYASRLVYRSIKSGLQQAARKNKLRYNRKAFPGQNAQVHGKLELIKAMNKDAVQQMKSSVHCCEDQTYGRSNSTQRTECTELLHFSESLARSITCDVRKKLKISGACLPKSLTDSCLYKKTEFDEVTGDLIKTRISRTSLPFSPDHKLYHSTGSLNDNGYSEGIIQAIEQYARKVADDTLEMSLGSAVLHVAENRKNGDKLSYTEKLSPFSGTVCRCCSMKEHRYCTESTSHHLPAHESSIPVRHFLHSGLGGACQKSRVFQLDIPKIHVDVEQKTVLSDKGATAAIEKAEGELSYTSLTADSGIGQDGVSFAESLTTEIMTSAMTNIGQTVNVSVYLSMPTIADHLADCTESSQGKIAKLSYGEQVQKCSVGREGFHSVESIVSQQMSLSIGDDSTGSWSNLSFEDEHPDESSSFLHLSDSNGNSSSWSSLGLEGDMYEENLSFPTSDSDGTEDKDEDSKDAVEGLEQIRKTLAIVNIDLEPNLVDPQLRATLQWLAASETEVSELYFHDSVTRDFVFLTRRLRERDWKVGDLLQAVLKYCEMIEKASDGEQALNKSLVGWLLENV